MKRLLSSVRFAVLIVLVNFSIGIQAIVYRFVRQANGQYYQSANTQMQYQNYQPYQPVQYTTGTGSYHNGVPQYHADTSTNYQPSQYQSSSIPGELKSNYGLSVFLFWRIRTANSTALFQTAEQTFFIQTNLICILIKMLNAEWWWRATRWIMKGEKTSQQFC